MFFFNMIKNIDRKYCSNAIRKEVVMSCRFVIIDWNQ